MDKAQFMREEYVSLRDEIKETKARIFTLAGFGLVALPSAYGLAQALKIDALILSLPILICTIQLLYLSESRSLMRAGEYIKKNLEERVTGCDDDECRGWEHWLEDKPAREPDRRSVDKLLAIFFYLLYAFYYLASVELAVVTANHRWGVIGMAAVLGFYVAVGGGFIWFLAFNYRRSVSTNQ